MKERAQLPNDIEKLKDIILEQQALIDGLQQQVAALLHQNKLLLRQLYGQRSEKRKPNVTPDKEEDTSATEETHTTVSKEKPSTSTGRQPLPPTLPRERCVHDLSEEEKICSVCGHALHCIGEEISEQLEFIPASLKVIEHVRLRYACRPCEGQVQLAALPFQPIAKGLAGPGLLAHLLISKYQDHLPLHRQEVIFKRHGISLSRSTLCDWVGQCAHLLRPLIEVMKQELLTSPHIHTDDTPMPVQASQKIHTGRLWVYVGGTSMPTACTLYDYTRTRSGKGPQAFLAGYRGYLQADAFGGYDELYRTGDIIEVACWAHARRKFDEIAKQTKTPGRAHTALAWIGRLYEIERDIKTMAVEERKRVRLQHAPPLLNEFKAWAEEQSTHLPPKSPLAQAFAYVNHHWQALNNYLREGYLDIDNNKAEQAIRPLAVGRNNYLFFGSDQGGKNAAIIYSVLATCKQHDINPFHYLRDILTRLPSQKMTHLKELLPYQWKQANAPPS